MMIVRPKNCHYCGNGFYALGHVVDYARSRGWDITDIQAEQAVKENIYNEIQQDDPAYYYSFGHGSSCVQVGDTEQEVFSCGNTDILANRTIYFLSCLCGISLGPDIIANGGNAFAGYDVEWTWITEDGTDDDPYNDRYAKGMYESANELWVAIIENNMFQEAVQRCVDKYNKWIDYWFYDNPEDEYSQEAIRWLAWNRDGLVTLINEGPCTNGSTRCIGSNLYTCENEEWVVLEENSSQCQRSLSIAVAIPVLLIVGIAFIAMTGKLKKTK